MNAADEVPNLIEFDPVEAAAKAAKMKQIAMYEAKKERDRQGKNYVSKSVRFREDVDNEEGAEEYGSVEGSDMEDEEFDENEMLYDSEEEDDQERKFKKENRVITFMVNNKPADLMTFDADDQNTQVKHTFKPIEGVKFKQYDEFGIPIDSELHKFITNDNSVPDYFIEAPPEQLARITQRPTGVRKDYEKEVKDMTEEGKWFM